MNGTHSQFVFTGNCRRGDAVVQRVRDSAVLVNVHFVDVAT